MALGIRNSLLLVSVLLFSFAGAACQKRTDATTGPTPVVDPGPVLKSVLVESPSTPLQPGREATFAAKLLYSDGSITVPAKGLSWFSSNKSVIEMTDAGIGSAKAPGNATVTAAFQGVIGSLEVVVNAPAPTPPPAPTPVPVSVTGLWRMTLKVSQSARGCDQSTAPRVYDVRLTQTGSTVVGQFQTGPRPGVAPVTAQRFNGTVRENLVVIELRFSEQVFGLSQPLAETTGLFSGLVDGAALTGTFDGVVGGAGRGVCQSSTHTMTFVKQ